MTRSLFPTTLLALLLVCPIAAAQTERVLIPIALSVNGIEGAYGSRWTGELSVYNGNSAAQLFETAQQCISQCVKIVPSGVSWSIALAGQPGGNPGLIAFAAGGEAFEYSLRVRDLSRAAQSAGVQIPVIRDRDLRREPFHLLALPTDPRFRVLLRIYDPAAGGSTRARVKVYGLERTIADFTISLAPGNELLFKPAFAQVAGIEGLQGTDRRPVTIEVTPLDGGAIWGFASVTNNESQEVTTVFPN